MISTEEQLPHRSRGQLAAGRTIIVTTPSDNVPSPTEPQTPADANPGWAQRGLGRKWQQQFFATLIRLAGKRPAYHMAYVVSFWYVLFSPAVRRRCRFYLDRRFPDRRGILRRFLDCYRLVRSFSTLLVDLAALPILGQRAMQGTFPDVQRLLALCQANKGLVLVNAHVGCWQIGLSALGGLGKPISLVVIPEARSEALLDHRAARFIDPRRGLAAVVDMTQVLLRGEIVSIMGDRTFGDEQSSVKVTLLGQDATLPVSPYRLASATGAPVAVLMVPKTGYRTYEVRLVGVIDVPPGLGRNPASYAPYAQQLARLVQQFVAEYPWQFYNFYDLWADAAPGGA